VFEEHAGDELYHKYASISMLLLLFRCKQSVDVGVEESSGTRRYKVG
jgi:hypothetical protein